MPSPSQKVPPARVVRVVEKVRAGLGRLHRATAPGSIAVLELATGSWTAQAIYVAAELGIPDQLAAGPQRADEVARRVGADPGATYRLMRALASRGVLHHRSDDRFTLTALGDALRSDTPGSMRDMVLFLNGPEHWAHWGELLHAVRTGETGVEKIRGTSFFNYLDSNPQLATAFNNAMTAMSDMANVGVLAAYDFTAFRLIADVGGGHGRLLAAILAEAPQANGVLFDLPSVIADAAPTFEAAGVSGRATVTGGSFLETVPDGADAYVLKSIIHDWDDETALRILRNVRTAIADGGKLLLIEQVIPSRATPHFGLMLDLEMLVAAGGRERTRAEYANLLSRAGFRLTRVVDTVTPASIVEAEPF